MARYEVHLYRDVTRRESIVIEAAGETYGEAWRAAQHDAQMNIKPTDPRIQSSPTITKLWKADFSVKSKGEDPEVIEPEDQSLGDYEINGPDDPRGDSAIERMRGEELAGDENDEPDCADPRGHSWVENEETGGTYCEWCLADGDA